MTVNPKVNGDMETGDSGTELTQLQYPAKPALPQLCPDDHSIQFPYLSI